jgi:hypothetical protein
MDVNVEEPSKQERYAEKSRKFTYGTGGLPDQHYFVRRSDILDSSLDSLHNLLGKLGYGRNVARVESSSGRHNFSLSFLNFLKLKFPQHYDDMYHFHGIVPLTDIVFLSAMNVEKARSFDEACKDEGYEVSVTRWLGKTGKWSPVSEDILGSLASGAEMYILSFKRKDRSDPSPCILIVDDGVAQGEVDFLKFLDENPAINDELFRLMNTDQ